jgi:thioredoxin reductase
MAAELKVIYPAQKVTLIHSRAHLLSSEPLPDEFKERALSVLLETGVEVILNDRVVDTKPIETADGSPLFQLTLGDGTTRKTSHVIWALSKQVPTSTYLPAEVLNDEGYVRVAPTYFPPFTFSPFFPSAPHWLTPLFK